MATKSHLQSKVGFAEWTPRESVRYLGRKEALQASQVKLDKLENFLMYPDKRAGSGRG